MREKPIASARLVWLAALLALAAFVLLGELARRHPSRFDWTRSARHTLSARTVSALRALTLPLVLTAVIASPAAPESEEEALATEVAPQLRTLLRAIADAAPARVRTFTLDALREPARARSLLDRARARLPNVVVVERGERRRVVGFARLVERAPATTPGGRPRVSRFRGEEALLDAILGLERAAQPVVAFTKGAGERELQERGPEGLSELDLRLRAEGYATRTVDLTHGAGIPADVRVLALAGPREAFDETRAAAIESFLRRGGALLALLDPRYTPRPDGALEPGPVGLEALLHARGIRLATDVLHDAQGALLGTPPDTFAVRDVGSHESVAALAGHAILFVRARGLEGPVVLARSSPATRRAADPRAPATSAPAPVPVVVLSERAGRVIVAGDSDFASNAFFERPGNRELTMRAIEWLSGEGTRLQLPVRAPTAARATLTERELHLALWLFLGVLPGAAATAGAALAFARRRRR